MHTEITTLSERRYKERTIIKPRNRVNLLFMEKQDRPILRSLLDKRKTLLGRLERY